jgi:integrase/recombinase XerD
LQEFFLLLVSEFGSRTATKHLERMKSFFKFCVDSDWMETSPARSLKPPKIDNEDGSLPFDEKEVEKIILACKLYDGTNRARLEALMNLMLASGLRISDAVMIHKDKIARDQGGYKLELRTTKTGTHVYCPLPKDVAEAVLALPNATPFWSGNSNAEDCAATWRKAFARLFELAGVDGSPHQFRHTLAKRLLMSNVPVGIVAQILRHKKVAITEAHYSRWIPERQERIDDAVRHSWSQFGHNQN